MVSDTMTHSLVRRVVSASEVDSATTANATLDLATKNLTPARSYFGMRLRREPYSRMLLVGYDHVDDCMIYRGTPNRKTGYVNVANLPGSFPSNIPVHRVAYEKWHGPASAGLVVDHMCHNEAALAGLCLGGPCRHRACVNPSHLRAVTMTENISASPLSGRRARQ